MEKPYEYMSTKTLLAAYAAGRRDFRDVALPLRADLVGAELEEATFKGALMPLADLRCANLNRCDLRGAILHDADLRHARLVDADLRGADLRGVAWADTVTWGAEFDAEAAARDE